MNVLVTGGAGYIGSHTLIELIDAGYTPIVVDNLSNASEVALRRVEEITKTPVTLYRVDIRDDKALKTIFQTHPIDGVIHFAGLKAVGESVAQPLRYYDNNVCGTRVLCEVMEAFDCKKIVFSSSATVYGDPHTVPITEDFPLQATNPYGRSKLFIEEMLRDLTIADDKWQVILLRYFNPVGAHPSGLIGEDPKGIPNNLMPYIAQVAVGKREFLGVFGSDYPTKDGTGVRDYIHVADLARGHIKALEKLPQIQGAVAINLGTGKGYSVLEVLKAFEKACGKKLPYRFLPRRPGDIAECYADASFAKTFLGWEATLGIEQMCQDAWRWQSQNPNGYEEA